VNGANSAVGYRRAFARRWLYRLRYPITAQRFWSLSLVMGTVYRLVPRPSLGRYEFGDPAYQLKAEWLDSHSEWADYTTGDSGWGMWYALFHDVPVPWSLGSETWLMKVDSQGFVGVERYDDHEAGMADFEAYDEGYKAYPEDDGWREGQPEFNGAFR